jgi:hypothetical protein
LREVPNSDHGCSAVSISSFANGALSEQFWQDTEERQRLAFGSHAGSLLLSYQTIIVLRVLLIGFGSD